ncbi:AN1-type zinc finger protein 2B [Trypanosoma rangeli]|uniref:AN1-type zinc finger protein 2B n=1 Tax=Trypanosoma rangeli TaxID=5698 RepID=A0A3S5ISH4_TRYRA|nr:AN1-type zinc finger protein 2B [Trypanosoma rangeli]RNF11258.1 AN1-type zinc finger protein 2B [Trypanosoma rangeli]|eukprot:RNF11258.1 AN1-type zinc finger protein 2B [Trypanosoma rangeli]
MQVGVNDDESKRCTFQGCTEVDPLASRCRLCGGMFCAEHTTVVAHTCSVFNAQPLTCPICLQSVPLERPGQPPDEAVSRHIDRGCRNTQLLPNGQKDRMNYCSYADCHKNDVAAIICEDCGNMYCIEHRAPVRHRCRKSRVPRTAASLQRTSQKATLSSAKTSTTASPSSLSKNFPRNTPSTALGVRAEGAVTPLVLFAKEFGVAPFFMYFPRLMVVGRLLDLAVSQAALESMAVNNAKGAWMVHVIRRPHSSDGFSVFAPRLSATLKEAGVGDGSIVYIGKQQVVPDDVVKGLAPQLTRKISEDRKENTECTIL